MPFIRKVRRGIESLSAETSFQNLQARFSPARDRSPSTPYSHLSSRTQTRIVVLRPGWSQSDQLHASLEVVDLADNPLYEAISYAWGAPRFTDKRIYIDGREVPIRYNLWACLRSLSDDGRPQRLWIDAISIRQDDPQEMSHQVSLIGSIFNQATRVRVWLGEHEQNSQLLFQPWSRMINDEDKQRIWRDFIDREYFKRRWCIQEILLAKDITVQCGPNEMSWNDFFRARYARTQTQPPIHRFDGIEILQGPDNHLFFELLNLRTQNIRRLPLLDLMDIFADAQCTRDIDKVYAFLAVDKPLYQESIIQPDYKINFADLFIEVVDGRLGFWHPDDTHADKVKGVCRVFDLNRTQVSNIQDTLEAAGETWEGVLSTWSQRAQKPPLWHYLVTGADARAPPLAVASPRRRRIVSTD